MQGERKVAKAIVELPAWREHEEAWFKALRGVSVAIDDPGISGTISTTYDLKVREVHFGKKISPSGDRHALEASLTMSEPVLPYLRRRKHAFLKWTLVVVLTALIGVLIKGLL